MRQLLLYILTILAIGSTKAQDIHFSQFFAAPYQLNPALTGDFNGNFRFIGNHRTQWRAVTKPYQTFAIAAEAKDIFNAIGVHSGLAIYNDKAGDSRFGTFQCNFTAAYDLFLSGDGRNRLTVGVQPGFNQRSFDPGSLTFDNQFIGGRFDANNGSGENFQRMSFTYFTLASGLSYGMQVNQDLKFSTGIAVYNLNQPGQSFFNREDVYLPHRYTAFARAEIALNTDWYFLPSVMFMAQSPFKELVIGSGGKYLVNTRGSKFRSVSFGTWMRVGDAGFVMVGADYNGINMALSYDLNFSGLVAASHYRGGLELSLIYILKTFEPKRPVYKFCPTFI
jgi:type IX secretion system PorP/SprF family membrane protein